MIPRHIRLTSHPGGTGQGGVPLRWGAAEPGAARPRRGQPGRAIGTATRSAPTAAPMRSTARSRSRPGRWRPDHRPDLTDTAPVAVIGPWPQWADPKKIVSLDPYGHLVGEVFAEQIARRHRRPADDRGDRGRISTCRKSASASPPATSSRTAASCWRAARSASPRRRSTRCGTCPASPSGSASPSPNCAARLFEETGGMFSGAGDPAGPRIVPAADRRHRRSICSAMSSASASPTR